MYNQTAPLILPLSHPQRAAATNPKLASRLGIAIAVLLHALVLLIVLRQIAPPPLKLAETPAMLTVFSIPAERVSAQINVAAPPPPVVEAPVEKPAAKPVTKPKPRPKPKAIEKPLIAAAQPTPAPPAPVQPAPAAAAPEVAAATPPPPEAMTSPSSTATVTSAPPATQGIASPQPRLSPQETDRLERQYAMMVSRMISASQRYPVLSKQYGESGRAVVRLKLARDGRVLEATLVQASGYTRLDDEARAVMSRVGRFMPVPKRLWPDNDTVLINQPVSFGLR